MSAVLPVVERVPFYKRLYIWSVIFEPLLLFVLFEASSVGITGNVSRLLQALTCSVLLWRLIKRLLGSRTTLPVPNLAHPAYRYYVAMFVLAVVAGVIGYARGAFELPEVYGSNGDVSALSTALNSAVVRPIFEYVTAAYYFTYFVVLPRYLITTEADVNYALSRFRGMFIISFVLGVIDAAASAVGIRLIPRHLADWSIVGEGRFHGLAGEPRQAFVYLFLGLAMFHLASVWENRRLNRRWFPLIIAAAVMTKSTTGIVGVALFGIIYSVYALREISLARLVQLVGGFAVVCGISYAAVVKTPRVLDYFRAASGLWYILEHDIELPYLMSKSNSDIYPMYDLTVKARADDWLPIVIGSGFGSASAVSNRYSRDGTALNNPHSQLARSLYETGIVGTVLYVIAFIAPVVWATRRMPRAIKRQFIMLSTLLVACSLADRSAAPFIYLGIFVSAMRLMRARQAGLDLGPARVHGASPAMQAS